MKAQYIYENVVDILRPKSEEDIANVIPQSARDILFDCYNLITHYLDKFGIIEELGFYCDVIEGCYYGFKFIHLDQDEVIQLLYSEGEKRVIAYIKESEYYVKDINSVDDFMLMFDLYEPITEGFNGVLKPKSSHELESIIPPRMKDLIEEAYTTIVHNKKYTIESDISYYDSMYGFQFESVEPLGSKDAHSEYEGELAEFTFGYFPKNEAAYIIFENNGHDHKIYNIDEFYEYLELDESDFEQPQGVFENISSVLKPKSEKELKIEFEKENPKFVKIFNELFPNEEFDLTIGEDRVEASFAFTETDDNGERHTFLVNQHSHEKDNPVISYLDKSRADDRFGGIFTGGNHVIDTNEVREYVQQTINPVYRRN